MSKHFKNQFPQGRKFESFTGMQNTKIKGPWEEVITLAVFQQVNLNYLQPDLMGADIAQMDQLPVGQYEPGLGLYL